MERTIEIAKGGTISGGTMTVSNDATLRAAAGGAATLSGVQVENSSTIDISGETRLAVVDAYVFGNAGSINVGKGSTLALANSRVTGNTVALDGTLEIDTSLNLKASVALAGSGRIVSGGASATLTSYATISGGGKIGDATLTLANRGAITAAAGEKIEIATGDNIVGNYGSMLASVGATLGFASELRNVGGLLASGGTVRFDDAVNNLGTMQVDGSGSLLDYRDTLTNSGAVSATSGGTIYLRNAVIQKTGGALVASDRGSRIVLEAGASIRGGQISVGYLAALEASAGGQVRLSGTTVNLDESSDIKVTNATLTIADSVINADRTAGLSASFSKAVLALSNSSVNGGVVDVSHTRMLVSGAVTLTGTLTRLERAAFSTTGRPRS